MVTEVATSPSQPAECKLAAILASPCCSLQTADGTRTPTINLVGTLRDGQIEAAGNFEGFGRTATLKWQRQ